MKDGKSHQYGLSHKIIVAGLLFAADTDKLLAIVKEAKGK
jgi:hypothetical protein